MATDAAVLVGIDPAVDLRAGAAHQVDQVAAAAGQQQVDLLAAAHVEAAEAVEGVGTAHRAGLHRGQVAAGLHRGGGAAVGHHAQHLGHGGRQAHQQQQAGGIGAGAAQQHGTVLAVQVSTGGSGHGRSRFDNTRICGPRELWSAGRGAAIGQRC
ncbi:hypothetical protein AQPW35_44370 [Rubrivivax pictus]|uniref:Uncharacterized protein n=1 Tax=Pseudaquabacterium pictum TaxID=2315236 RepID=A0A480AWT5_9BURK|nr:hypothetical protein AQPW35_44370 [Rubrivivax pictus]